MANRRMINRFDAENPPYFRMSIRQRYLFDHLMLYSDDDGITPFAHIKPKLFLTDLEVNDEAIINDINTLQAKGYVTLYNCPEGEPFLHIQNWWDRQTIRREIYNPTIYPLPPHYLPLPETLAPGPKPKKRNATTNTAQDSREKGSSGQANLEESSPGKDIGSNQVPGEEEEEDSDLPYERDGSFNPRYQ